MKKLKSLTLNNKEWAYVKKRFVKFYKTENRCSNKCPMGYDDRNIDNGPLALSIKKKNGVVFNDACICHQFKEFNGLYDCPCFVLGQQAFDRLEQLVKREFLK